MSQLDQAFIKAYGKEAGGPPPAINPAMAAHAPVEPPAERPRTVYVDAAHEEMPAPHNKPATDWLRPPAVLLHRQRQGAAAAAPRSAMYAEPTRAPEPLRPAFEVPRFTWPRMTEILIAAAGNEFADLASLLTARSQAGCRQLAITGSHRCEGRTTLVLALGRVLAGRGLRVALVDADVRHPQLAVQLRVAPQIGWEDVLSGRDTLAEALIESAEDRVTLLPRRGLASDPMLFSRQCAASLAVLVEHFDLVLVDVGPLDSDAATVDLALLVRAGGITDALVARDVRQPQEAETRVMERRLMATGLTHWDLVETFVRLQPY